MAVRRDWAPLIAGVAWITGFEAVFQVASLALGNLPLGPDGPIFYIVLGSIAVPWATRSGARPSWPLLVGGAIAFVAWLATGFHVNDHTMVGFDPVGEALNEAAKSLLAAAYLLPLFSRSHRGSSARADGTSTRITRATRRREQPAEAQVRAG